MTRYSSTLGHTMDMTNDQLIVEMQKTDAILATAIRAMQDMLKHEDKSNSADFAIVCEIVKEFLEDHDYINDPRFALQFGRSRIENKKVGKLRLERELKAKGLESATISGALNSLYEEFDERKIAMVCAKKKLEASSSNDIKKERGRLAKFLERKGFDSNLVYQVVTQLVPRVSNNDLVYSPPLTAKQHQKTVFLRNQD